MSPIDQFVADFKSNGWSSKPFERLAEIIQGKPDQVLSFVRTVLNELPDAGTFFDASLSFLPEEGWPEIVEVSVGKLIESKKNESAESVIAYASLQCPASLHRWLDQLLEITPNSGTYCESWPWRNSDTLHLARLEEAITNHPDPEVRLKAWQKGLETRHDEAFHRMIALESYVDLDYYHRIVGLSGGVTINDYLRIVAHERAGGSFLPLAARSGFHLIFPPGYVEEDRPWLKNVVHPTWSLVSQRDAFEVQFGGYGAGMCSHCGGRSHNLITSRHFPQLEGVFEGGALCFETCLSCLGFEVEIIYCAHSDDGATQMLNRTGKTGAPQFPAVPLAECTARLVPTPQRWQYQDDGLSNSRENLNRFGGEPCWVQDADYPTCPGCEKTMRFLAQLDSDLPTSDGGEWSWGDGGICYMLWCPECRMSAALWQCT